MIDKDLNSFTFTIDWEDFGQLMCRDRFNLTRAPLNDILRQTDIVLELLNTTNNKATFFILAMLAQFRPELVKKIALEGHEIAIHGSNHLDMRKLSRQEAYNDIVDSYKLITDIISAPVYGYRAPYFSIVKSNLYLLEVLTEINLIYDSSIFPIKLKRYGIENFSPEPELYRLPNSTEIVELPLTILNWKNKKVPVAGGGYLRIAPYAFVKSIFRKLSAEQKDVMIYMHPYEFDSEKIYCASNYPEDARHVTGKTFILNLKWNLLRSTIFPKMKYLLENYKFITCLKKAENVKKHRNRAAILEY